MPPHSLPLYIAIHVLRPIVLANHDHFFAGYSGTQDVMQKVRIQWFIAKHAGSTNQINENDILEHECSRQ